MAEIKPPVQPVPNYKLDSLSRQVLAEARQRKIETVERVIHPVEEV